MAVTPSKRLMNWKDTKFTPEVGGVAGTPVDLTGTTDVRIDPRGSVVTFSGDADQLATLKAHDFTDPQVTVTCADLAALHGLPPGTRGQFTSTHLDARNGAAAGGGAYAVTLDNAIVVNNATGGAHRQIGQGTLTLEAESDDGVTNPLSYTAA